MFAMQLCREGLKKLDWTSGFQNNFVPIVLLLCKNEQKVFFIL